MSTKSKCCVRDCDSRDTHEYQARGTDNRSRSVTCIVSLCDPCKDGFLKKKVHYTFSKADTVVFVNEIY